MLVLLILLGFGLILLAEVPVMVAAGQWRELRAFGVLLLLGLGLSVGLAQRWLEPRLNDPIRLLFEPIAILLKIK